jgi:beta-1,2-mannobiose phosphorylase / 1,2-beta-oligomannan phosphorylase
MNSIRFKLLIGLSMALLCSEIAFGQFTWTKDARNPVMSGIRGTWDTHVFSPCVLFNSDSARYEMWFTSTPGPQGNPNLLPWSIGFAVSKDGINWSIYPSVVLKADSGKWDNSCASAPEVIRENRQYKMWYTSWKDYSSPYYIGYATSSDGIHWTKYAGNPIFGPGTAAWEIGGANGCSVMPVQGGYKIWYVGSDASFVIGRVGYATSTDGINWKRDTINNPVLSMGPANQWDEKTVGTPNVLRIGNAYYMWYSGSDTFGRYDATGVATSPDGITNWQKHESNPVLRNIASPTTWEATWAEVGAVLQRGDTLHMWYEGYRSPETTNKIMIGHATSLLVASGVSKANLEVPASFFLSQNYPNPFNPSTTITFELPQTSHVNLSVYNTLGIKIATLVNEERSAGVHTVQFNGSGHASGVYYYRLRTGEFLQTMKLVLVK